MMLYVAGGMVELNFLFLARVRALPIRVWDKGWTANRVVAN